MSSQTGWPEGARAECGSDRPRASATTCDVAAVPRNWQPPPGEAQARQPSSAASSSEMRPCAKRAPSVWIVPASSPTAGGSVTPPGTITPGSAGSPATAIIIAGSPLSQVAMPRTPWPRGSDRASRRRTIAASFRYGQAVEHAGRALRPPVAGVGAGPGERDDLQTAQLLRRGLDQEADLPVPGVVPERDRLPVGGAQAALRAEDEELPASGLRGLPPHAGVLAQAEEVAARAVAQQVLGQGQAPRGAGSSRLDLVDLRGARVEDVAVGAHARASPACSSSGVTGSRASQQRAPTT